MTGAGATMAFMAFLIFCRIGGCLMFAPGFSSARVPLPIRLALAVAISLAITPLLYGTVTHDVSRQPDTLRPFLVITETLVGSAIGLMARFFVLALQFAATAASSFIGLAGIPGIPIEESESGSALATLASTAAVTLILITDLHMELLRAMIDSYSVISIAKPPEISWFADTLVHVLAETSLLALRLSAPFLAYGVIVNLGIGLGNKFAAQMSVYHATTGLVILGGFLLLSLVWGDWMALFLDSYRSWLMRGGL